MTRALLAMTLLVSPASADWLRFRGPNGSGVSNARNLPAEFSPTRNVVWKQKTPRGVSSPVIAGNRLFLTGFDGDLRIVLCFDARTGDVLWRKELSKERTEQFNPIHGPATPTPAADANGLYVFFPEIGLIAYDMDGKQRWRAPLGPFNSVHGIAASPVLAGGNVILSIDQTHDSYLAAFDARTGRQRWKIERPSGFLGGYATPAVIETPDRPVEILAPAGFELAAFRADTGRKTWWAGGISFAPAATPVVGAGMVFVNEPPGEGAPPFESNLKLDKNKDGKLSLDEAPDAVYKRVIETIDRSWGNGDGAIDASESEKAFGSSKGRGGLVAVRTGGRGDIAKSHIRWRYTKSLPYVTSPLLCQNVLYVVRDGGILTSLNPETGEVFKQGRLPGALEPYYASPVAADGKVFALSESGKVTVVKAGPEWEILATNDLGEPAHATPAIDADRIYIRTRDTLYCFGLPKGIQ